MRLDVVIFGGGAAGLWLLDALARGGARVLLLEARALGSGQTIASQGIIHGGLKYTLGGLLTPAATGVRDMPRIWRDCLAGRTDPNLTAVQRRADFCYLWRSDSISSRLGMIGARLGLNVAPRLVEPGHRPPVLADCPGAVARLDEQVISPASFLEQLSARHRERMLLIDQNAGAFFSMAGGNNVELIQVTNPYTAERLDLRPQCVVFAAGAGNADLRRRTGLSSDCMQRRPLHMVLLRGSLPPLNGHCVDGAATRVTITSDVDSSGRTIWQLGGQVAENGVALDETSLIACAAAELRAVIPRIDLSDVEWATYRVDRAEAKTESGARPQTCRILRDGNIITAWPTKLVLAPKLAQEVVAAITATNSAVDYDGASLRHWPRPHVAQPPWETCRNWSKLDELPNDFEKAA